MAKLSTDISQKIDIECRKSDSLYLIATLETGSHGSGNYFNVNLYTGVTLIVKNSTGNSVLELYKSFGTNSGVKYYNTITTTTTGNITITATSTAMTIPEGSYTYTCKISNSTTQHTVMHGKFKIVD
tara:strand:- start:631 stop:1011 length:381 start_codon:yes stop_codon:yes gene_type:complete